VTFGPQVSQLRRLPNTLNVLNPSLGVVAALEFVQYRLSEMGHRNLLVTHTYPPYADARARLTRSVRRASGFVQTPQCSVARLCHLAGGELDQIQFLLGHVSIQTTERYLGCKQKLRCAVNDRLGIEPDAAV
jgi:hypothetical protein